MSAPRRIAGIDPGSRSTGWALVTFDGRRLVDLEAGSWSPPRRFDRPRRLRREPGEPARWVGDAEPEEVAVESLFHHRNVRSVLALAEARGVLLSVFAAAGVPVHEYPPATIKKAVTGAGAADKAGVRAALVATTPGLDRALVARLTDDATDAIAVAICHRAYAATARRMGAAAARESGA